MGRDALSGLIFVDDALVWDNLEITFSVQAFRQLLKQLRQRSKVIFPSGLPCLVVVTIAVMLDPPFQIGALGGHVDLVDELTRFILRDVILQVGQSVRPCILMKRELS